MMIVQQRWLLDYQSCQRKIQHNICVVFVRMLCYYSVPSAPESMITPFLQWFRVVFTQKAAQISRLEWSFWRDCFLRSFLDDFFKVCIVPLLDSNRCRHRWRGFARVVSPGTCCHVSADEHNILLLSGPFEMIGLGPPTRCEWACDQFVFLACVGIANPFVCQRDTIHDKKNTSKRKTTCPRQLSHQS